jgi:hypothetical protein
MQTLNSGVQGWSIPKLKWRQLEFILCERLWKQVLSIFMT